jgi:probable HAF family extracellular repeat protein
LAFASQSGGSGGGKGGGTPGVAVAILDLGAGDDSEAEAVNDKGQIVGSGGTSPVGFVWANGAIRRLGTLPGMTSSRAEDINENGQVVGYASNGSVYRAFLWTEAGGMQPLEGSLGGCCTLARAINDLGVVVGEASTPVGTTHAVVWENGVMRDIQSFATGSTFPWDISNYGAVGQWNVSDAAFVWTSSAGMSTLAGLAGHNDIAIGINDLGQVVGWYPRTPTATSTAFLWTNGVITDLGTLGGTSSVAWAINNAGQVVGRAHLPRKGTQDTFHAFLWTAAAGMRDLGLPSDAARAQARDLNETGWVVGERYLGSGRSRATLWKLK